MQRIYDIDVIEKDSCCINICKLTNKEFKISLKNPHCTEYFCTKNKISDCKNCMNYLLNTKKILLFNKDVFLKFLKDTYDKQSLDYCKNNCSKGYVFNYIKERYESEDNNNLALNKNDLDKFKGTMKNFKQKKLSLNYDLLPYKFNYEYTFPAPKTVIHWGQLKMFCITLFFLVKVVSNINEKVHIIYAGSAAGDNILYLCKLFPNTQWYLIDPRKHVGLLYIKCKNKDQIQEIIEDYFTDDTAKYYYDKFKNRNYKLLFLSDIREGTEDEKIIANQEQNVRWHNIIKPDYSYFKFRLPYNYTPDTKIYDYYDGKIYLQLYAPQSSTETRILFKTIIKKKSYNIEEYAGKLMYFNRVIRPSYYKSIIPDNNYFDHCYDCVGYSYLIRFYLKKYNSKVNKNDLYKNTFSLMKNIVQFISKHNQDKILIHNKYIRTNLLK